MEYPVNVMTRLTSASLTDRDSTKPDTTISALIGSVMGHATGAPSSDQESTTKLTTAFGHLIPTVSHAYQIDGRPVSSDTVLFEKQQTFNRSKTLERMVHPCGSGAFGYFEVTHDQSAYCKATLFNKVGRKVPVFVRFSTVTYGREFPDSARNPRGFAIKFYTDQGNYDIVGLNWPIFFVRDPMKGPDVIRSQQRHSCNFLLNYEAMFDFLATNPESLHAGAMLFSNSATPVGWRHMNGFGCHTFKWVNTDNSFIYVKYHFIPECGIKYFTYSQAQKMCGIDPDFAKRDLWEHLEQGKEAKWTVLVQMMTEEESNTCEYDPFDVTKVWFHKDFPLHEVGRLILNKNPENYHRDVEQVAFSPGNLVPGIEPSPDLLLNWRLFFYRDAQYHRLGVNHHQIPVNCPFMAKYYSPQTRDGIGRSDSNGVGLPTYMAAGSATRQETTPSADFLPVHVNATLGRIASSRHEGNDTEYDQVRIFYSSVLDDGGRDHLHYNTAKCLCFCSQVVKDAYLKQLDVINPKYRTNVEKMLEKIRAETSNDLYQQVL